MKKLILKLASKLNPNVIMYTLSKEELKKMNNFQGKFIVEQEDDSIFISPVNPQESNGQINFGILYPRNKKANLLNAIYSYIFNNLD